MAQPDLKRTHAFKLPSGILGAALSLDEQTLVAACLDGVYATDLSGEQAVRIGRHDSYVSAAVRIPGTDTVVTGGYDGMLQWFDVGSRTAVQQQQVHQFWCWALAASPDASRLASVTGQYLAGGYRYDPAPETEPSVRVLDTETGEALLSLPHVPSVQSVAFSPDSQFVAAGNLMGEVRIWNINDGELVQTLKTDAFTSWGIIKSHCYLGGIFAIAFSSDGSQLLLAGMGPMRDPMAGNGRQLWQKWSWRDGPPQLTDETHAGESGEGLMETLAIHPTENHFVMAGRLRGGDWNAAIFDLDSGGRLTSLKTGYRVTQALYAADGRRLILVGAQGQPHEKKDGTFPDFGRVEIYEYS
jgi:WD40 repeat protein